MNFELDPLGTDTDLPRMLAKLPRLTLDNAFQGRLHVGRTVARVQIQSGEELHVVCRADDSLSPPRALEDSRHLPGNLRFARRRDGLALLADVCVDGQTHLAATFAQLEGGLRDALGMANRRQRRKAQPLDEQRVQEAVEKLAWGEDAVVRSGDVWELRPRVDGQPIPVRAAIEHDEVRVQRVVLDGLRGGCASLPVADQALRLNAQLRHARLASDGSQIVAEARLHSGLVSPFWLSLASRAVAVAERHSRTVLQILHQQEGIAQHYSHMFLRAKSQAYGS